MDSPWSKSVANFLLSVLYFEVIGPYATIDAAQAQKKSDLWRLLFKTDLRFSPTQAAPNPPPPAEEEQAAETAIGPMSMELPEHPGLSADDTMTEAARKTFAFHFQHMLYHEQGTREGENIEKLHKMQIESMPL